MSATPSSTEEIAISIGASRPAGTMLMVIFVPSVDREGAPVAQEHWVNATLATLGRLFRGATAYPRGLGVWRDDERGGNLIFDEPVIVTCYANPADVNSESLEELRRFLHRLGREANQGEVGIVIDQAYYPITEFDAP